MPYGSLNLSDPHSRFSSLNPYVNQTNAPNQAPNHNQGVRPTQLQSPIRRDEDFDEIELEERPPLPRGGREQELELPRELSSLERQPDFDHRLEQINPEQVAQSSCCSRLGNFLSSFTQHIVLGQGTLTGESYGLLGTTGGYAGNTLGSLIDAGREIKDNSLDPTANGVAIHDSFGAKTQWFSTGSTVDSKVVGQGRAGGVYAGITGSICSLVGTVSSVMKLSEGGSARSFAKEVDKIADGLLEEIPKLRALKQNVLPDDAVVIPIDEDSDEDIVQVDRPVENPGPPPRDFQQDKLKLINQLRGLQNADLTLSEDSRRILNDHIEEIDDLEGQITPGRFNELLDQQIELHEDLAATLKIFAQARRSDGNSDLLQGGLGLVSSLNGLTNAVLTNLSLGYATGTETGNRIASGLIFTQAIGATGSLITGSLGAYEDYSTQHEASGRLSRAQTYLQKHNERSDQGTRQVSQLVESENSKKASYATVSKYKNGLLAASGLSLLSGSFLGATAATTILTPVGWTLAATAGLVGVGNSLRKYMVKSDQLNGLKQEPAKERELETLRTDTQQVLNERRAEKRHIQSQLRPLQQELENMRPLVGELMQKENQWQEAQALHNHLGKELDLAEQEFEQTSKNLRKLEKQILPQMLQEINALDIQQDELSVQSQQLSSQLGQTAEDYKQTEQALEKLGLKLTGATKHLSEIEQAISLHQEADTDVPPELDLESQLPLEKPVKPETDLKQLQQMKQQVSEDVLELGVQVDALQKQLSGLGRQIESLKSELEENSEQSKGLELESESLRETYSSRYQEVPGLREQVRQQDLKVQNLDLSVREAKAKLDDAVQELDQADRRLGRALNDVDVPNDASNVRRFDRFEAYVQEGVDRVGRLDREIEQVNERYLQADNALKSQFPRAAVRGIIEDLRSDHDPIRQAAENFVHEVLQVNQRDQEWKVLTKGDKVYAAELLISKLGLAYLS